MWEIILNTFVGPHIKKSSWVELYNEKKKRNASSSFSHTLSFFLYISLSIYLSLIQTYTLSLSFFLEDVSERVIVYPVAISARSTICLLLCEPFRLIGINGIFAGPEICLFGLDLVGSFDVFPAYDHDEVERDTEVASLKNS